MSGVVGAELGANALSVEVEAAKFGEVMVVTADVLRDGAALVMVRTA